MNSCKNRNRNHDVFIEVTNLTIYKEIKAFQKLVLKIDSKANKALIISGTALSLVVGVIFKLILA